MSRISQNYFNVKTIGLTRTTKQHVLYINWLENVVLPNHSRPQWPRSLRHASVAARSLGLRVRIPPAAWMSVCCECCMLSSRDLCDGLTTRPEESYQLWSIVVCDLEISRMMRPWSTLGRSAEGKNITCDSHSKS
jgi:hypothetical protein